MVRGSSTEEKFSDNYQRCDLWNDAVLDAMCFDNGVLAMARAPGARSTELSRAAACIDMARGPLAISRLSACRQDHRSLLGVPPLADGIGRREDAFVYRPGLSNQAGPLEFRFRDKSYNFTHVRSKAGTIRQQDANIVPSRLALVTDLGPLAGFQPRWNKKSVTVALAQGNAVSRYAGRLARTRSSS